MRVLVTGAGGFVGRHVVGELNRAGHTPLAFDVGAVPGVSPENTVLGDLRDAGCLGEGVLRLRPDACIHLAGIAFVPKGWTDPNLVLSVNLLGTINLLEAFRRHRPNARLLAVTSAELYGKTLEREGSLNEDSPAVPSNLYGVSKLSADLSAQLYARRYAMPVMTARPTNHMGPGQSLDFVTPSFAGQLVRIERGEAEPLIRVGNLDSERDFVDGRDVARAYRLLIEKGRAGQAYNIASGKPITIRSILDGLCEIAGVRPRIEIDPARFRPTDKPPHIDASRIRRDVGWEPEIGLAATLKDVLEDVRGRQAR